MGLLLGLKLHSTDTSLISEVQKLGKEGFFDFIELYVVPGSYMSTIEIWKPLYMPFIIHAPHSRHGVNFASTDRWETNLKNFKEVQQFANALSTNIIIIHGGNNGSLDELIRQMRLLNEERIAIENKPKIGLSDEICVGWSPEEFYQIEKSRVLHGIVLDFGHAIYAAKSMRLEPMGIIEDFMSFNPKMYHLSDGYTSVEKDVHLNLGMGDFDLFTLISIIPKNSFVTIETPRNPLDGLKDFVSDVMFLKNMLGGYI